MIDNNKRNDCSINNVQTNEIKEEELLDSVSMKDNTIIDARDIKIAQLQIELDQLKECERDITLRLKAEIENIRRRNTQEIEKTHKFALERFIIDLLPVIDNLERTLSIIDRSNTLFSAMIEGIELTLKSFLDTVHKFGVESVDAIHVPFNPAIHQAISTMVSEECDPNQILNVIQKGYILNGRLIRPAMVVVSCLKS